MTKFETEDNWRQNMVNSSRFSLSPDDDVDDVDNDDEFEDDEFDEDEVDDEEDEGDDDTETWQVRLAVVTGSVALNSRARLTSGNNLPRLAPIWQLNYSWTDSAGPASRRPRLSSQAPD